MKYLFSHNHAAQTATDSADDLKYVPIDLPFHIEQMRNEHYASFTGNDAIKLHKDLLFGIVLIKMTDKGFNNTYNAKGSIRIEVLQGKIICATNVQTIELNMGETIFLHESLYHHINVLEQTVLQLTLRCASNF